mmetsp:Transcript_9073/g.6832  ORF Transcript_9073/g.6832 Transcript_9073/m.6832 type:complete len:107 (+) Transcript_9073:1162-1482(+)
MAMTAEDRDLVIMKHEFTLEDKSGHRWKEYSSLVSIGEPKSSGKGYTSMALTVGVTAAIVTRMILEGRIKERGVLSPIHKDIYEPCLKELEKFGVRFEEESSLAKL